MIGPRNGPAVRVGYRLVPCPGAAHKPEANGMIDNCTLCAPRWGEIDRLTPEAIAELATGMRRGGAGTARELARVVSDVLGVVQAGRNMTEIVRDLQAALRDYLP